MKNLAFRIFRVFLGFFALALGIVIMVQSQIGLGAWDVLHDGVSKTFGITLGQATMIVGILVLSVSIIARQTMGIATVLNILIIGLIVDIVIYINIIPLAPNFFVGLIMGVISMCIVTFGIYLYVSPGLGAGPRDTFLVLVSKWVNKPVAFCRTFIELSAVIVGFFLGGSVGVGTVMLAVLSGPIMQIEFKLLKFDMKGIKHESFIQSFKNLKKPQSCKSAPDCK